MCLVPVTYAEGVAVTVLVTGYWSQFYFVLPHHPRQRGTNEIRYSLLPATSRKGELCVCEEEKRVQEVYDKLNRRPRKRLQATGRRTGSIAQKCCI